MPQSPTPKEKNNVAHEVSLADSPPEPTLTHAGARSVVSPNCLVTVMIPCCGQLEYTRLCVPSVIRHSRQPYELIFVEVGSLDGTSEFLDGVAASAPVRVEVVHEESEGGFASAVADGVGRARGECVVWLNNDTIVTDRWLQQLVALASAAPEIGAVGPMSNHAPAAQLVADVLYRLAVQKVGGRQGIGILEQFAHEWRDGHKGQWAGADRLGGFCLLLKREVLKVVPLVGSAEDKALLDADDVSFRVQRAGYRLAICRDLFIHHFGSHL
jgi:GT2 family glycosyltransferase